MPPKRKAAASKRKAAPATEDTSPVSAKKSKPSTTAAISTTSTTTKGKRGKKTAEATPVSKVADKVAKLTEASKGKKKIAKVDPGCPMTNASVYADFDATLNQTNIGQNNNKFYIIQLVYSNNGCYYCWNRWGRVGETGANSLKNFGSNVDLAIKDFKKKFQDKTRNKWENRDSFEPVPGKYTLLEMDGDENDDGATASKLAKLDEIDGDEGGVEKKLAPSKLDVVTKALMRLLFDNDTFVHAMQQLQIDTKKMPLGKLSKVQIAKGFETLEKIERLVEQEQAGGKIDGRQLEQLCSQFYTIIPHAFGRQRPLVMRDMDVVQKKYEMLNILGDVEIAQSMKKEQERRSIVKGTEVVPHHLDVKYDLLLCDLEVLDKKSQEYKVIEEYTANTKSLWRAPKISHIWKVKRHDESDRFKEFDSLTNRKLLWHGTSVAVVAAILKTGLRIMPHSGGRVGKGIYFASENGKSAGYVGTVGCQGIMFLNEVVLGKEHIITQDDHTLKAPPKGHHSVIARGQTEPDPSKDTTLTIDGKSVVVPKGSPISIPTYANSHFSQSEYLIYNEAQNRIRYLLLMDM